MVGGEEYEIRTDFRDILRVVEAFADPNLTEMDKVYVALAVIFIDYADIPHDLYEEAYTQAIWFLDAGQEGEDAGKARVMDWAQDEPLIFPAINKIAGYEVRTCDYLHWWTFIGYYMEITEGVFSTVLSMRSKKQKGKLDKEEAKWWAANKRICVLKSKLTDEEEAQKKAINDLINGVKKNE